MILYSLFYSRMLSHIFICCVLLSDLLFSFSECVNKLYCHPNLCANNQQHTLCKFQTPGPAPHCLDYELTIKSEKDKQLVLDKINARRDKVAAGEIRSLPSAEDMFKMEWDEDLAISAQRWADQCVSNTGVGEVEDDCRDLESSRVGQNIATVYGEAPGLTPTALVDVWYMQLLNVNSSLLSRYRPSSEAGSATYNHFTQLVWSASYQVGCGGVKFKEHYENSYDKKQRVVYRLVCNFAPQGNQLDQAVYTAGQVGMKCAYGTSSIYKRLCNFQTMISHENDDVNDDEELGEAETTTDVVNIYDVSTTSNQTTILTTDESESEDITFDYFSHLYELTKDHSTSTTTEKSLCKNDLAVDQLIEIVKNKLSDDPALKLFFTTTVPTSPASIIKDEKVAALLNKIYNKATSSPKFETTGTDFVNSSLLVNLVEAVIFRSTEEIQEIVTPAIQIGPFVSAIKVQAVSAAKANYDFTGHYFFPEYDEEEIIRQTTEIDYDGSGPSAQDVVIELEEIRKNRPTRDFLDEILETESVVESTTTTIKLLSPDDMKLQTIGYSNMKNFLKDITEKSESNNYKRL